MQNQLVNFSVGYSEWSLEVVELCKEFQSEGVIGIDLAGDEAAGEIAATTVAAYEVIRNKKILRYIILLGA